MSRTECICTSWDIVLNAHKKKNFRYPKRQEDSKN